MSGERRPDLATSLRRSAALLREDGHDELAGKLERAADRECPLRIVQDGEP